MEEIYNNLKIDCPVLKGELHLSVDIVNEMDRQLDQKIEKRRFFQDIQNSFQWVTGIGPKMPQFFSF